MPRPTCTSCQKLIVRKKGISTSTVCHKCSNLFHNTCLNTSLLNDKAICSACSVPNAPPPDPSSNPSSPYSSLNLTPPCPPISQATQFSIDSLSDAATPPTPQVNAPSTSVINTYTKRQRSSPPEQSQPLKIFGPPTPHPSTTSMAHLANSSLPSTPTLPASTPDWALAMFEHTSAQINSLHLKFDQVTTRLTNVEKELMSTREDVAALHRAQVERDTCEVRISGIPASILNDSARTLDAIKHTLDAIKCSTASSAIYRTRIWKNKSTTNPSTPSSTGAVAVQFSSTVIRDDVLSSAHLIKNSTALSLFGSGDNTKIFISPVLPPHLYQLSIEARKRAKEINYAPPLIRPSGIFMRANAQSQPIPILTSTDLLTLAPNLTPMPYSTSA